MLKQRSRAHHATEVNQRTAAPFDEDTAARPSREVLSASGVLEEMELLFGERFGDVRVHPNSARARAADAEALTDGRDVHVAGTLDPSRPADRELLAHELTHVVQQRGQRTAGPAPVVEDPGLEREAHRAAVRAARGERVAVSGRADRAMAQPRRPGERDDGERREEKKAVSSEEEEQPKEKRKPGLPPRKPAAERMKELFATSLDPKRFGAEAVQILSELEGDEYALLRQNEEIFRALKERCDKESFQRIYTLLGEDFSSCLRSQAEIVRLPPIPGRAPWRDRSVQAAIDAAELHPHGWSVRLDVALAPFVERMRQPSPLSRLRSFSLGSRPVAPAQPEELLLARVHLVVNRAFDAALRYEQADRGTSGEFMALLYALLRRDSSDALELDCLKPVRDALQAGRGLTPVGGAPQGGGDAEATTTTTTTTTTPTGSTVAPYDPSPSEREFYRLISGAAPAPAQPTGPRVAPHRLSRADRVFYGLLSDTWPREDSSSESD